MLRFRSFRATLLTLFLGAVAIVQIATFAVVAVVNQREARVEIESDLQAAARAFQRVIEERTTSLVISTQAVASDDAFRRLFFESPDDAATVQSALTSAAGRIQADFQAWVDLDGATIVASEAAPRDAFAELVFRADESEAAQATGYAELNERLYAVVAVPIRAPVIVGWWVAGFRIDSELAGLLRDQTAIEVSFANAGGHIVGSSLDAAQRVPLAKRESLLTADGQTVHEVQLDHESWLLNLHATPLESGGEMRVILQYSLDEKLAPARRVGRLILLTGLGGLALAGVLGLGLARRLSRPVQQLAAHTQVIAGGDYAQRLELNRADELGDLARSFNAMSDGLAERDRVRDLLDKNVSPEVAAKLLREGAALGGEEREVTVLFADLRGFTTLSEKMEPRAVVELLNRYLDRMSAAIEARDGVIDKFIGDEIMALFGAPVGAEDDADRALAAALAMRDALREFNGELAAEGHPQLAFGVGINTARVIAGNIGSHRRLNYSVIGDGVNLAARLQTLTRNTGFDTDIIISAATLAALRESHPVRDLGRVGVKGRSEAVHIYGVD